METLTFFLAGGGGVLLWSWAWRRRQLAIRSRRNRLLDAGLRHIIKYASVDGERSPSYGGVLGPYQGPSGLFN